MKEEKQLLLNEIKEKITSSPVMIVTRYEKLDPNTSWKLNTQLEGKGFFEVVKKRLFVKAAEECGLKFNLEDLNGHIGIVFVRDEGIDGVKNLFRFSGENEGVLAVLAGRLEGKLYGGSDVEAYAKLPPLPEMRAQFLGLLTTPHSQFLSVMESLLSGVLYCLDSKEKS